MKNKVLEYAKVKYGLFIKKIKELHLFYGMLFLVAALALFLAFGFSLHDTFVPSKALKVTFYDVGQGDGIFIESGAKTKILIDGGSSQKIVTKVGAEVSFFDKVIDFIAPSHADKDHIAGAIATLDRFPVRTASLLHASTTTELDDEYERRVMDKVRVRSLSGDTVDIGGDAKLTVLLPKKSEEFSEKETNDSSSVLLLTYGPFSFLFTGDLPETRERELIQSGLLPRDLTVLKLGHHGSKYSSGKELLSYAKPKYVIVSAGKGNRYGHPNEETLERVGKVGSIVLRTDEMGDIIFLMKENQLTVETEK